jgi:hypothetical protein
MVDGSNNATMNQGGVFYIKQVSNDAICWANEGDGWGFKVTSMLLKVSYKPRHSAKNLQGI